MKRRRLAPILASLSILVIGIAWVAAMHRQAQLQQQAVEFLCRLDASVEYDYQFDSLHFGGDDSPTQSLGVEQVPDRLSDWIGIDMCHDVVYVSLPEYTFPEGTPVVLDRRTMDFVGRLRNLRQFDFWSTDDGDLAKFAVLSPLKNLNMITIPQDAIQYLTNHPNLEVLWSSDSDLSQHSCYLSPQSKVSLRGLTALTQLEICLTDGDLACLSGLYKLRSLTLKGGKITGRGLRYLTSLQRLCDLDLGGSPLDQKWISELTHLGALEELNLYDTQLNCQGLLALTRLPRLKTLNIADNHDIDDQCVMTLKGFRTLKVLVLSGTSISANGVHRLKELLPGVEICID